jgi:hypothetical protein
MTTATRSGQRYDARVRKALLVALTASSGAVMACAWDFTEKS